MAKVQESRFALLHVEDDSDEDSTPAQAKKPNQPVKATQKKQKNKKKKQSQAQAENEQLKHLAFGQPTRHRVQSGSSDHGQQSQNTAEQWNEWQKMDAEYTADTFEKDLQQALLLSRLETEQEKQRKKEQGSTSLTNGHDGSGDHRESKKKKKKDKPNTMSLEQFNKQLEDKKTHSDELEPLPQSPVSKVPPTQQDPAFFDNVQSDVSRILRQEKMQEEYKKQYAAESVITAKYQDEVKKKDREIEFLRATMKKQEEDLKATKEELKQVKKRNKQLCVILAQGEMKDKAEVLMQVDQLTEVKDELTEQVTDLTAELEKERSKVHSMKTELDRLKICFRMDSDLETPRHEIDFNDTNMSHSLDIGKYQQDDPYLQRKRDAGFSPNVSQEWKMMSTLSPGPEDSGRLRIENNQLKLQVKQLTVDLQSEQDTVSNLRKRLNGVERDRLETASKCNHEISELESQIAKLRAQLEKGEASKANMEFELTRARREINQHKQAASDKETTMEEANTELKQKLTQYGDEIKRLEDAVQQSRETGEEREKSLRRENEMKDMELSKCKAELDVIQGEKEKLDTQILQLESTISDLNEKVQDLESERKHQTDNLRRTMTELEYCKEREERSKKDLETAVQRLRAVEESVESERAAHLETKFNSEIVQLRVRDLDGALEVEKSANTEANKAIDRLTKQIRELENSFEDERKNGKQLYEKLTKVEKEYSTVKKQLTNEVDNKKTTIGNLSKELEIHQKNFIELKEELSKAKKRQVFLEETYGGSMRELELLLENFQISEQKPKKQTKGKDSKSGKTPAPAVVLENLRLTLTDYRKRLDNTSDELSKMKKLTTGLNKEIDQCKEMIWTKDKALEDAQKSYTRTAKELNRVRSEYGELETLLTRLKVDMQSTASNQSKDRTRIQELSEEIMKLVKKHKTDEEEKLAFLHGLYQRLLAGRIVIPLKEKTFNQFSWHDLTNMVFEQVSTLINNMQSGEEKINHLEEALRVKEEGIEDAQHSHQDQLNKLTTLTKERELSWQKQKEEIEAHYQQLIDEMQSRVKKSQSVADQAWEKIRVTGGVQQELESECSDLQSKFAEAQKQNSALLAACSLLIGAFYPLCSRSNFLSLQRRIMEEQLNNWDVCRERVELLVSTLTSEMNKTLDNGKSKLDMKKNPLLVFRMGAIVVIAANRLRKFGRRSARGFITYDSTNGQNNILVCTGGTKALNGAQDDGDYYTEDHYDRQLPGEKGLLDWLTSTELLHTLTSSTTELLDVVNQLKAKDRVTSVETRAVVNAAKNSFTRLFDRLGRYYENIAIRPDVGFRERSSLVKLLGRGLNKVLKRQSVEERFSPLSPQDLMMSLQTHILDFTQRLHGVEVERRQLLQEVARLQDECDRLGPEKEELLNEQTDVAVTKQGNKYIPLEKFENVCIELNNALRREEQAQNLLHEQSKQLEELSVRLELFSTEGIEKEQTLSEAIQGLAEGKLELRRKEQTVRQLNKQTAQLESEKESLCNNLQDAEKALRTVAKDKEILSSYIVAVESALGKVKRDLTMKRSGKEISLSKALLNADFIPEDVGKAGPELIACQNLVGGFVDTHHHLMVKVKSLEDEIEDKKRHVNLLKQELNDAVRREHGQFDPPTKDGYHGDRYIQDDTEHDFTQREFVPLREDSEVSFNISKPPGKPRHSPSPRKADRSGNFSTPHKMTRARQKGGER